MFFKHKKKRIIKFIEEIWINTLVLLAFKLTHTAKTNKNKIAIEDKDGNKSNPDTSISTSPLQTPAPKPTRALNDPRYKNE